jgi:hypothetical protein
MMWDMLYMGGSQLRHQDAPVFLVRFKIHWNLLNGGLRPKSLHRMSFYMLVQWFMSINRDISLARA